MKILWFIENLSLGGLQTQSINIIKEISVRKNIEVDVLYLNDGPLNEKFKTVCRKLINLKDFDKKTYQNPINVIKLLKLYYNFLKLNKYDVIISHGIVSFGITSILKKFISFKHARLLGAPLMDMEPTYEKYFHNILPFHINLDLAFGFPGENIRCKKRYGNKLKNIGFAVDTSLFKPKAKNLNFKIRKKLNINKNDLVIGWVGRIASNMQIRHTIALGGELRKRGVLNFKILIVGGGDWESEMADLIRNENIVENCICLGWQPMEYVPDLFQVMDIVPLLEKNPAGGSIVREAMACGKLVISVDGKNNVQASWIKNEDNGILVSDYNYIIESADVIEDYLKNKSDKYDLICKNGLKYAKTKMTFKMQSEIIMKNILND